jgi:hypothetical protein
VIRASLALVHSEHINPPHPLCGWAHGTSGQAAAPALNVPMNFCKAMWIAM